MQAVIDINRPDTNRTPAKMQAIADEAHIILDGMVPELRCYASDNIMSSVSIVGNADAKEDWINGIWENGRHFRFNLLPIKGARYYNREEKVTVELLQAKYTLPKFRKSTCTIAKAIERVRVWIASLEK